MPIINTGSINGPLSQGDILKDINLFTTKLSTVNTGGEAAKHRATMAVVLSRPCVCFHKPNVVVAAIEAYAASVSKEILNFQEVCDLLAMTRDGDTSPDQFYLGEISGFQGRFCARLDTIHTIQVPQEPNLLKDYLSNHRIGRLHPDFSRDLHLRLFRAFASLGFDDYSWYPTPDLEWVVETGRREIAEAEGKLSAVRAELSQKQFANKTAPQDASKRIQSAEDAVALIVSRVQPFIDELAKRNPPTSLE